MPTVPKLDDTCPKCKPAFGMTGKVTYIDFSDKQWRCQWPTGAIVCHEFAALFSPKVDRKHYPKDCPHCGAPAYVGVVPAAVDCSARCRP